MAESYKYNPFTGKLDLVEHQDVSDKANAADLAALSQTVTNNYNSLNNQINKKGERTHILKVNKTTPKNGGTPTITVEDVAVNPDDGWKIDNQKQHGSYIVQIDSNSNYAPYDLLYAYKGAAVLEIAVIYDGTQMLTILQQLYSLQRNIQAVDIALQREWDTTNKVWGKWHEEPTLKDNTLLKYTGEIIVDANDNFDSELWDTSDIDKIGSLNGHYYDQGSQASLIINAGKRKFYRQTITFKNNSDYNLITTQGILFWSTIAQVLMVISVNDNPLETRIKFYHRLWDYTNNKWLKFTEFQIGQDAPQEDGLITDSELNEIINPPLTFDDFEQLEWVKGRFEGDLPLNTQNSAYVVIRTNATLFDKGTGLICLKGTEEKGNIDLVAGNPLGENITPESIILYTRYIGDDGTIYYPKAGTVYKNETLHEIQTLISGSDVTISIDGSSLTDLPATDYPKYTTAKQLRFGGIMTDGFWKVQMIEVGINANPYDPATSQIAQLVPVRHKTNNKLGLWDLQSRTFYEAQASENTSEMTPEGGGEIGTIILHNDGTYDAYNIDLSQDATTNIYASFDVDTGKKSGVYSLTIQSSSNSSFNTEEDKIQLTQTGYWAYQSK